MLSISDIGQTNSVVKHNITTTMKFTLPPYAFHTYWAFHNLSYVDVVDILKVYPAQYIWMSALLYGIDIQASAIKPSFSGRFDILVSSKSIALKKIIYIAKHMFPTLGMSKLNNVYSTQIPPIPTHIISSTDLTVLKTKFIPHTCIFDVKDISGFYTWNSSQWFPVGIEKDLILCKRVHKQADFIRVRNPTTSNLPLCATPLQVRYQNELFVLLDEAIIFCDRHYS